MLHARAQCQCVRLWWSASACAQLVRALPSESRGISREQCAAYHPSDINRQQRQQQHRRRRRSEMSQDHRRCVSSCCVSDERMRASATSERAYTHTQTRVRARANCCDSATAAQNMSSSSCRVDRLRPTELDRGVGGVSGSVARWHANRVTCDKSFAEFR